MEQKLSLTVFVILIVLNTIEFTSAQYPANNSANRCEHSLYLFNCVTHGLNQGINMFSFAAPSGKLALHECVYLPCVGSTGTFSPALSEWHSECNKLPWMLDTCGCQPRLWLGYTTPTHATLTVYCSRHTYDATPVIDLVSAQHASIDVSTLTVSGFSTGGFMTTTMHYVFSSKFRGAGLFAGGPFGIGYNISSRGFIPLYVLNTLVAVFSRSAVELQAQTVSMANQGLIDPVTNLNGSNAFVYNGGLDPVIPEFTGIPQKVIDMYKYFGSNVTHQHLPFGTHCVPTDNFGGPCQVIDPLHDFLNNCGVESVFEMFAHLYGKNYIKPSNSSTPYTGHLYDFDQNAFAPSGNADTDFMNDKGGLYIPLACQNVTATCKLHVAFHGCLSTIYTNIVSDKYALNAGYLQVADKNNVIVVFPRAAAFGVQLLAGKTNLGCWDWFGTTTTTTTVPFKQMPQVKSVMNILNGIIGSDLFN